MRLLRLLSQTVNMVGAETLTETNEKPGEAS
ncbi:hypothetical protein SUDANB51_02947 [Streptomyces sp. enrichment culture]